MTEIFKSIFKRPYLKQEIKTRIQFIDLAKGFCILLVLIDHCGIITGVWLNHLRMPLYFVLSGLFFKDYGTISEFLRKKVNNILIPFIAFYAIGLIYAFAIDLFCHNSLEIYKVGIPAFFYGEAINNYALWFLLALFWTNIAFYLINHLFNHELARAIIVAFIAALGIWVNKDTGLSYLYVGASFIGIPLFYFGYLLKKSSILYDKPHGHSGLIGGGVFFW
ncbi:MAG: acyltransferase family protein [Clostridium sp.]|nr:acyltransferase family protein [Clostridium sp.]